MSWRFDEHFADDKPGQGIAGSNSATSHQIELPVLGACTVPHIGACMVGGTVRTADLAAAAAAAAAALAAEHPERMKRIVQHMFACNYLGFAGTGLVVVAAAVAGSRPSMVQHTCSCTVDTEFPAVVAAAFANVVAVLGHETS